MPGLSVPAAGSQPPGLHDALHGIRRHGFILISAHGQDRTHGFEDFHGLPPFQIRSSPDEKVDEGLG
jgi:hypothetical protein